MKSTKKILLILMVLGFALSLFACGETTNNNVEIASKPAFNSALTNYETLENRGSDFEAKFIVSLYGACTTTKDSQGNTIKDQTLYTVGQHVTMRRIRNNGKIYIEGELSSCDVNDNLSSLLNFAL